MAVSLDDVSRLTLRRFGIKLWVSAFLASLNKAPHLPSAAKWLMVYAVCSVVMALLLKQRFPAKSFTHWDEALWLAFVSLGLRQIAKAM